MEQVKLTVIMVSVKELKIYKLNPSIRTDVNTAKLKELTRSIEANGLQQPLLISDKNVIVDGNRRYTACKKLGYEEIPCIRRTFANEIEMDALYQSLNNSSFKLTTAQEAERYLLGGIISDRLLKEIKYIEDIGGVSAVKKIIHKRKSPHTYYICLQMYSKYTESEDKTTLKKVLNWILAVQSPYYLKAALSQGIPLSTLTKKIKSMQALQKVWD